MRTDEVSWAAGFFDGEGSISVYYPNGRNKPAQRECGVHQTNQETLERFLAAVGAGKIYGPYQRKGKPKWRKQWVWRAVSLSDITITENVLYQHLTVPKRNQWDDARAAWRRNREET